MSQLLLVLSGPSSVGKRCIVEALRLFCRLGLLRCSCSKVVLYNTRPIRPTELDGIDYHYCADPFLEFGSDRVQVHKRLVAAELSVDRLQTPELLRSGDVLTYPVRDALQAIDLSDLQPGLNLLEIHDQFLNALLPVLADRQIRVVRLFIAPFSRNELSARALRRWGRLDDPSIIASEMQDRLRARQWLGLSAENDQDASRRLADAIREILAAFSDPTRYDAIVVNPCGEAHPDWGASNTIPTGDARLVVDTVCGIIEAQL